MFAGPYFPALYYPRLYYPAGVAAPSYYPHGYFPTPYFPDLYFPGADLVAISPEPSPSSGGARRVPEHIVRQYVRGAGVIELQAFVCEAFGSIELADAAWLTGELALAGLLLDGEGVVIRGPRKVVRR